MNDLDWDGLGLIVDHLLLPSIAFYLLLKALILRRRSELGRSLAANNIAMGVAYLGAVLAIWIDFFGSSAWRWTIRLAILWTAHQAAMQLIAAFGGWRATGREVRRAFIEDAGWIVGFLLLVIGAAWLYWALGFRRE